MNHLLSLTTAERNAIQRAIEILCQVFWGPNASFCEKLFKREIKNEIESFKILKAIDSPDELEAINPLVESFRDSEALFIHLETIYVSTFISNKKGRIVPLYQSCYEYENAPMMGPSAIAMQERLAEVGLSIESRINELPDHLCIELEYLYFLCEKGWKDENGSMLTRAVSFTENDMLPWVLNFQKNLMMHQDALFYSMFTSNLIAVLKFMAGAD